METEVIDIKDLEDSKLNNYWFDSNGNWIDLSSIIDAMTFSNGKPDWDRIIGVHPEWKKEIIRIKNADYHKHPILVIGKNHVIDGVHRLTKAWIYKETKIKIKRFTELPKEVIISKNNDQT